MSDTQWPRYQVFVQEQPNGPFLDTGSVHAPDAEMALLNARDVFARRPGVYALWVVPAAAIYSRTRQELESFLNGQAASPLPQGEGGRRSERMEKYYAFCKPTSSGTQTLLGTVEASTPAEALSQAIDVFSGSFSPTRTPFAWWVFPERLVTRNDPQETLSLFAPALGKPFRLSGDYHVVTEMRRAREGKVHQ